MGSIPTVSTILTKVEPEAARRFHPVGEWPSLTLLVALLVMALLGVYAFRSLSEVIRTGLAEPPAAPPSDTLKAATMIVKAIQAFPSADTGAIEKVVKEATTFEPPSHEARRHRRRTALL